MFKNIKIKKKLIISFVVITILASISGITSIFVITDINDNYSYAIENYGFAQGDICKVMACFGSINTSVHDSVSYRDNESQKKAQSKYESQLQKMDEYFKNVELTIVEPHTLELFNQAKNAWAEYRPLAEKLMKDGDSDDNEVITSVQARIVAELDPLYDTIYDSLAEVLAAKVNSGTTLQQSISKNIALSTIFIIVVAAFAIIISLVLGTLIANGIADPVKKCAKRLLDLSNGDLKTEVPQYSGKDEIGILAKSTEEIVNGLNHIIADEKYLLEEMARGNFNIRTTIEEKYVGDFKAILAAMRTINTHLSETLSQINESSQQVSSGSDQVSSAAQNLSQGAAEQAASIEALAQTIEGISEQVSNNAENAQIASEKARNVGSDMEVSNEKMQHMMKAMGEISESSSEIGKIIKTIEDIAFQTNILALNAAVEAARAGEAGKGFAVVADEVRNLASKSSEASKNTAQLIEASIRAVENGTKIADETAQSLMAAVDRVEEVVHVVEKISIASVQQSSSVEKVTVNVDQISSVVQNNSATAEESAAASEELNSQAQILKALVGKFTFKES